MERKEEGVWIKKQIEQRIRRSSSSRDVSEAKFDCPDNNNNKGAQRTLVVGGPLILPYQHVGEFIIVNSLI